MRERAAAHGHPVWWVLAGIVVGIGGTAAALWRDADNEPLPDSLGTLVGRSASSASPMPRAPGAVSRAASDARSND